MPRADRLALDIDSAHPAVGPLIAEVAEDGLERLTGPLQLQLS